jgi:alpha-N-arabinofuranosidase
MFSLTGPTYRGQPNGFRPDLVAGIIAMKPTFLKFPGGVNVQGTYSNDRFDWKEARGPLALRPGHNNAAGYRSSDGMGLLEFMELCEDLHVEPVLTVFSGLSTRLQVVEPGPLLDSYVQDTVDELDYLMGDAGTSYWGGLRAKDGHPNPFRLNYLEIGNDDALDKTGSYDDRLGQFYDAIKARYAHLKIIASMETQSRPVDYIDEHDYNSYEKILKEYHRYDNQDRKGPKIMVGAWADREGKANAKDGCLTPNFQQAMGDAIWMIGMERNADLVAMSCYAPLLVNVNKGAMQTSNNLIGYDGLSSYGSPSYYAQIMFANHVGDTIPATELKELPGDNPDPYDTKPPKKPPQPLFLPYSVTWNTQTGKIYIKFVNKAPTEQKLRISINGDVIVSSDGVDTTLHADNLADTNTLTEPTKVVPVTTPLSDVSSNYSYTLLPQSITVLEFTAS